MQIRQTLFSSKNTTWLLYALRLSDNFEHLQQASEWAAQAWGYEPDNPDNIPAAIATLADNFYLLMYGEQMIGMFCLAPADSVGRETVVELTYVFIHPDFRSLGVGKQMLGIMNDIARAEPYFADTVILDTVNPKLNKFYEKCGATFVADHYFTIGIHFETSLLRM